MCVCVCLSVSVSVFVSVCVCVCVRVHVHVRRARTRVRACVYLCGVEGTLVRVGLKIERKSNNRPFYTSWKPSTDQIVEASFWGYAKLNPKKGPLRSALRQRRYLEGLIRKKAKIATPGGYSDHK